MPFKAVPWKTSYSIDVTIEEFKLITDYDNGGWYGSRGLWEQLEAIDGVSKVDYDGHFGLHIYIDVDKDNDNNKTWDKIFSTIDDVVGR